MVDLIVWLLIVLSPTPKDSMKYAAYMAGDTRRERQELYHELRQIGIRESSLRPVRGHVDDRRSAKKMWRKAKAAGWISRSCPESLDAVHGIAGLSVPYNLRWLGLKCAPAWLFDIPIVSAMVAAKKHKTKCWKTIPGTKIREINPNGANRWCR